MKSKIFKKVAAFVTATTMAMGTFAVLPEECLSEICLTVSAAEITASGQCGDNVYWELDENGILTISGTGNMYEESGQPFYDYRAKIKQIIIKSGVTSISNSIFYHLYELTNVSIPDTVTSIGNSAFYQCEIITSINIPNSVTSIGDHAFTNCFALKNINIPFGVTVIDDYAFSNCRSLSNITLPNSISKIGECSFYKCWELGNITIPDSVTSIGMGAFSDCENMTNMIIPDSVNTMGDQVFESCSSLKSVKLSSKVSTISKQTFMNCSSLEEVIIPEGVTSIGEAAFIYCSNLKAVNLPSTLKTLDGWAFDSCSSITEINIPDGVTSIGQSAFRLCTSLTKATIPASVTSIGNYAFVGDDSLTIYGYKGTVAETYANENEIPFVALDSNETDYDKVSISSKPEKFNITYDALTGAVSPEEQDFTITLSYIDLSAVIDGVDKSVEIGAIELTAPEECILIPEGDTTGTSNSYLKVIDTVLSTNGDSRVMNFKLKAPNADYFATHKNVSDKIVVKLYNSNSSVVKTAEFGVNFKVINDDIPEGTIFIDEDVNGDLVVEDGQTVKIRSNVSCDRLIVKGGECTIPKGITLTVKSDTIVTGGSKPILGVFGDSKQGGKLIVNGRLETKNLTISECGVFEMCSGDSYVKVSDKFDISSDGDHSFSDGVLEINKEFKADGDCFVAIGNHLTIFDGIGVKIDVKKGKSKFNKLGFTLRTYYDENEVTPAPFKGKLYISNIGGSFYKYDFTRGKWVPDTNEDLRWICDDYNGDSITEEEAAEAKKKIESGLKKLYSEAEKSDVLKQSELNEYISSDDFKQISGEVLTFCCLSDTSSKVIDFGKYFGFTGWGIGGSEDVLVFKDINLSRNHFKSSNKGTVYIVVKSTAANVINNSAEWIEISWYIIPKNKDANSEKSKSSFPVSIFKADIENIASDLKTFYDEFEKETTADICKDLTKEAIKEMLGEKAGSVWDLIDVLNGLIKMKCNPTEMTAKDVADIFEDMNDIMDVYINCPVDVKITDDSNQVVGLVENNNVLISTEDVYVTVYDGDKKLIRISGFNDYYIKLTAIGNGTMDYIVHEYTNGSVSRRVFFDDLPLEINTVYTGKVSTIINQSTSEYALTDNSGNVHNADSDTYYHTHSYGTSWKYNSTSHWHECSCGEKTDIAQHISNSGVVTVQPTATTTGVKTYSCSVCGYVMRTETIPATGYNGYPSYPTYPTYPFDSSIFNVVTFTDKVNVTAETEGNTITIKWDNVEKADKYYVYQYKNGKYVKVKTTSDTSATFKKLKNGETYKFLVRYTKSGRLSPTKYSGTISVKVYYKPIPKPTASKNSIKLTWEAVPEATKYAVYKYVDGKVVKLTETTKLSVKIGKLSPDTEYKYIVRAYVDGKWTTMLKSDIVTVKTKAE